MLYAVHGCYGCGSYAASCNEIFMLYSNHKHFDINVWIPTVTSIFFFFFMKIILSMYVTTIYIYIAYATYNGSTKPIHKQRTTEKETLKCLGATKDMKFF